MLSAADPSSPTDLGARPSWQQRDRDRIPLAKMFGMPKGRALVWKPGDEVPRVSWVRGYFEVPELNARASPNPYFRGGQPAGTTQPRRTAATGSGVAIVLMLLLIALFVLLQ